MKAKKPLLITGLLIIAVIFSYAMFFKKKTTANEIINTVKKGNFDVLIVTSGELRSKINTKIMAPSGLTQMGIYQIKIAALVPEGTTVKQGEFVGSLDNSDLTSKINEQRLNIDKINSEIKKATLDTMLDLRILRDEIVNLKYDLRQKTLEKEQSKFEAPAEIKKVELDYERTERSLKQKEEGYLTKQVQAQTKIQIMASDLAQLQMRMDDLNKLMGQLTIMAPKGGMVIYERNWNGQKKAVGSQIEMWNNSIATLPDLSQMEVLTYVNEVDVQKVKCGQKVDISLDAAPEKKLNGIVKSVANIGEEKPNSDAKVFEVVIEVLTRDDMLRPAMTTSCKILAEKYEDALQIPLDAIYSTPKTSYVLLNGHEGLVRQELKVYTVNETSALISNGLKEGDKIYLSLPSDTSGLKYIPLSPKNERVPRQLLTIDTAFVRKLKQQAAAQGQNQPQPVAH
jgi:hypothetical protein